MKQYYILFISSLLTLNESCRREVNVNDWRQPAPINLGISDVQDAQAVDIFNSDHDKFTDGFDYTETGGLTVTPTAIQYSGSTMKTCIVESAGSILYHQYEYWQMTPTVTMGAMSINQNGFVLGLQSTASLLQTGFYIRGHPSQKNRIIIQPVANGSNAGSAVIGNSYKPGASLRFKIVRRLHTLSVTVDDGVAPVTATLDLGFNPYASFLVPALVTSFIVQFVTGTFTVTDFTASLPFTDIDGLFIGDSITQGQAATNYQQAYGQLLKKVFTNGQVFAGRGSKTSDILLTIPAILLLHPRKVTLMIGINDVVESVPTATIKANYASIVDQLLAADIEVILISILPNGNTVPILNAWMQSKYPSLQYINAYGVMKSPSTLNMDPKYSSDSVHPNDLGMQAIYEAFLNTYIR